VDWPRAPRHRMGARAASRRHCDDQVAEHALEVARDTRRVLRRVVAAPRDKGGKRSLRGMRRRNQSRRSLADGLCDLGARRARRGLKASNPSVTVVQLARMHFFLLAMLALPSGGEEPPPRAVVTVVVLPHEEVPDELADRLLHGLAKALGKNQRLDVKDAQKL